MSTIEQITNKLLAVRSMVRSTLPIPEEWSGWMRKMEEHEEGRCKALSCAWCIARIPLGEVK